MGSHYYSGQVMHLARSAHKRAATISSEADVCIVLCASAFEGFLNEIGYLYRNAESPESAVALSSVLAEAESSRLSPIAKFRLAAFALSGRFPRNGEQIVQGLNALFHIRNALMHLRPEPIFTLDEDNSNGVKPPQEVQFLISKGVVLLPRGYTGSWRQLLFTDKVSAWGYRTTTESMRWLANEAKDSQVQETLKMIAQLSPNLDDAA